MPPVGIAIAGAALTAGTLIAAEVAIATAFIIAGTQLALGLASPCVGPRKDLGG